MARPLLTTLALATTWGVSVASNSPTATDVEHRIAELRRRLEHDDENLDVLEGPRKLMTGTVAPTAAPSLYGDQPNTRPYTDAESHAGALNHMWMLICGFLIMIMQAGFALVEAGNCRVKNVQSILLKNLTDVAVGTLGWWIFGWSFAYTGPMNDDGYKENGFAGSEQFAGHMFIEVRDDGQLEPTTNILNWFFQWAFCATAATIVSGGIAERVNFPGYSCYSFLMTSFIYPIIVAWTWGSGWLAEMNSPGYMDFAGSGVVHLTGGIAALVGAIIAGPRRGRFEGLDTAGRRVKETPDKFIPHSQPLIVLGTFILWFGWYGFNCGSTLAMDSLEVAFMAAQVAMNTTIAAAAGGLTQFMLRYAMMRKYDLGGMCSGILGGLVSITAPCGNVESGSALLIGIIGGIICQAASSGLRVAKIDDPVDAFAVHGACGIWGVFAAAAFDWGRGLNVAHGWKGFRCPDWKKSTLGCVNDGTGKQSGNLFAANFAEIFAIIAWSGGLSAIIFFILKKAKFLVTADDIQEPGIDKSKHSPRKGYDINDPFQEVDDEPLQSI